MPEAPRFINARTALLIVVANMIGTGVFTTLGLQAEGNPDGAALLLLWGLGGLVALCGALCYAELAAALPRSGGEYHFLARIYHPLLGQVAGWVSVTVGFAAPVALAAMAMGRYTATFLPLAPQPTAIGVVLAVGAIHAFDTRWGARFQVGATWLKVGVILVFCLAGLSVEAVPGSLSPWPTADTLDVVFSGSFGVALVYVAYAYSGWNAAAYVVDEVQDPQRAVPFALIGGTLLVTLFYLLLNLVFLRTLDYAALAGTVEVGALSAHRIFGPAGGALLSAILSLLLVSTVSAMVLIGPRVLARLGEDLPALQVLNVRNRRGAPARAIWLQQGLALIMISTGSFEGVLAFAGFTLTIFALLTVFGVARLRRLEPALPRPFRVPLYPLPVVIFCLIGGLSLGLLTIERPLPAAIAGLSLGTGWWLARRRG